MSKDLDARVATLAAALSDEKVSVRWNAAKELGKLGPRARAALPALAEAIKSTDATTVVWGRYAIAKITGDYRKHLPVLLAALDDKRVFAGMAGTALAGFGSEAASAVPRLREMLGPENHSDNRWAAAFALASIGPEAAPAAPELASALADSDEKLRWYAAFALGEIGAESPIVVQALIGALEDFDDDVRGYAARALGKIGYQEALPALEALLQDENESVRREAESAIEAIRGKVKGDLI